MSASTGGRTAPSDTPSVMDTTSSAPFVCASDARRGICSRTPKKFGDCTTTAAVSVVDRRFEAIRVHLARARESDFVDAQSEIARVRLQHLAILRMQRARHDHAMPPGQPLGHEHGFGGRGRAVPHGGVRDFHSRELAHQRLKFEDRLQRALADLRLIRRVGSEEFAALDQRVRDHRAQVVVHARAEKAGIPAGIFRRARAEIFDDLLLGHRGREACSGSFSRNCSGIEANSFSMDGAPMASSISRRSAGLFGR